MGMNQSISIALKEAGFRLWVVAGHHQFLRSSWRVHSIFKVSIWSAIDPSLQDSGPAFGIGWTPGSLPIHQPCLPPDCRGSKVGVEQAIWETSCPSAGEIVLMLGELASHTLLC